MQRLRSKDCVCVCLSMFDMLVAQHSSQYLCITRMHMQIVKEHTPSSLLVQTEGLLYVMCIYLCLRSSSKDNSCLAHGASRSAPAGHVCLHACCNAHTRTIAVDSKTNSSHHPVIILQSRFRHCSAVTSVQLLALSVLCRPHHAS